MKALLIVGILLVVGGVGSLVYNVIPIHHQEEVAKIGPITATQDKESHIVIPSTAAIAAILGGVVMILVARRSS